MSKTPEGQMIIKHTQYDEIHKYRHWISNVKIRNPFPHHCIPHYVDNIYIAMIKKRGKKYIIPPRKTLFHHTQHLTISR